MKLVLLIFFIGSLIICYGMFLRDVGEMGAIVLIAMIGFNPFFLGL